MAAIETTLRSPESRTRDLGGTADPRTVTDAVVEPVRG
jgi:isocitrate/isopropylmalate dehydrogenase